MRRSRTCRHQPQRRWSTLRRSIVASTSAMRVRHRSTCSRSCTKGPPEVNDVRPLLLEIQGFTCYRDEQPPLDFKGMSLFAIAGPTGAGKSTILDAMLYALYGTVPRLVGRDAKLSEFVSHGSNVLSVRLDFQLRGETYR